MSIGVIRVDKIEPQNTHILEGNTAYFDGSTWRLAYYPYPNTRRQQSLGKSPSLAFNDPSNVPSPQLGEVRDISAISNLGLYTDADFREFIEEVYNDGVRTAWRITVDPTDTFNDLQTKLNAIGASFVINANTPLPNNYYNYIVNTVGFPSHLNLVERWACYLPTTIIDDLGNDASSGSFTGNIARWDSVGTGASSLNVEPLGTVANMPTLNSQSLEYPQLTYLNDQTIEFNGTTDDLRGLSSNYITGDLTMIFVTRSNNNGVNAVGNEVLISSEFAGTSGSWQIMRQDGTNNLVFRYRIDGSNQSDIFISADDGNWHTYMIIQDGNDVKLYFDNVLIHTDNNSTAALIVSDIRLARNRNLTTHLMCDFAEILLYDAALSGSEIDYVNMFLNSKHGVTV